MAKKNSALVILYVLVIVLLFLNVLPYLGKIKDADIIKPDRETYSIVVDTSTEFISAYKEILPSVVSIRNEQTFGSGVIFSEDGLIVTNDHVVRNTTNIRVYVGENRIYRAEVIGRDNETDLAVIKINATKLIPAKLGSDILVGEKVVAIGNPFGFDFTVTSGIASAKHRAFGPTRYKDFIQTDASINPGNSGGPLINTKGEVIGINTFILDRSEGLGFAIPIDLVKFVYENILEHGEVKRAFFGVRTRDNSDFDEDGIVYAQKGAYVISVMNNSAAEAAGFRQGDVIVSINDVAVRDSNDLSNIVARLEIGKLADVVVLRKGELINLRIRSTERN